MILAVADGIVATLVIGSGFHGKETLFIPLVWISKATVQVEYYLIPLAMLPTNLLEGL